MQDGRFFACHTSSFPPPPNPLPRWGGGIVFALPQWGGGIVFALPRWGGGIVFALPWWEGGIIVISFASASAEASTFIKITEDKPADKVLKMTERGP